jgi:hypothetical protein
MEDNMIICPSCNKSMIKIGAKIEGKWCCLWLCGCEPSKMQTEKWDKTYDSILAKYGSDKDKKWVMREI